jgi:prevent-host-death family protein
MVPAESRHEQQSSDAALQRGAAFWKLEDAKARFSELVRLAESGVPQHVSVRGREAIVILAATDYARLAAAANSSNLATLFANSPFARLDDFDNGLVRERSAVREAPDFGA